MGKKKSYKVYKTIVGGEPVFVEKSLKEKADRIKRAFTRKGYTNIILGSHPESGGKNYITGEKRDTEIYYGIESKFLKITTTYPKPFKIRAVRNVEISQIGRELSKLLLKTPEKGRSSGVTTRRRVKK